MKANRRELLLGLAAASTAAATAGAAATKETVLENPELVRLGNELPNFEGAYISALTECQTAYRGAMKQWPDAPEEIHSMYFSGDIERDVAGAGYNYQPNGYYAQKKVATVEGLRTRIEKHEREVARKSKLRSKRGLLREQELLDEAKAALPIAERYWSDCERIKTEFSYRAKNDAKHAAMDALLNHVDAIMNTNEHTMLGVVIKAQALTSWSKVETFYRGFNHKGVNWPTEMASAIMRQAGRPS